jgi:hypothetical protein
MTITKLFLTSLFICNVMIPAIDQHQDRGADRSQVRNRAHSINKPPVISSIVPSSTSVTIQCPKWFAGAWSAESVTVDLTTSALDPDGDSLLYTYVVTGGQINGEGSQVRWDLTGVEPGPYEATVTVNDQRGGVTTSSIKVAAQSLNCCFGTCAAINVSCPDDTEDGRPIVIAASVSGGDSSLEPIPNWTVSAGKIIKGQGTYTIEVDTTGLDGQEIEATFEVGGFPPECSNKASCKIQVRKKSSQ